MNKILTPPQLLNEVMKSSVQINGHTLHYDSDNNLIWITNPYGLDSGVLEATEKSCQKFLENIEKDVVYGLCPE